MQIDPEDFKRHYALLSDDALLEISRDELVEVARPYYDAELAERKLTPQDTEEGASPPDPLEDRPGQTEDGLQLVATFISEDDAKLARGLLRSADIPCFLENEYMGYRAGNGALRLMVPAASYDRACEILEFEVSEEELITQAEAEAEEGAEKDEEPS